MPDEQLSRKRLIAAGGAAALTATALGKASSAAAAAMTTARESSDVIGVIASVQGQYGSATGDDGATYEGRINSRRPLRVGDRVMIESADEGSYAISPLYVDVVGVVDSVEGGTMQIGGASYAVDSASVLRRPRGGEWLDSGAVTQGVRAGTALQALGILNIPSGTTVLAVTWVP